MLKFFKSKIGFTLVELLVVVLILGIILAVGIPAYRNVAKNSRIKACNVNQKEIAKQAKEWCLDNAYNDNFSYKITSDGETGTIAEYETPLDDGLIELLKNDVHRNNIPSCPACGEIIVIITPQGSGLPKIEVSCDGGNDGDCHKAED